MEAGPPTGPREPTAGDRRRPDRGHPRTEPPVGPYTSRETARRIGRRRLPCTRCRSPSSTDSATRHCSCCASSPEAIIGYHGWLHIAGGLDGFGGFIATLGVPAPTLVAYLVTGLELAGGILLAVGGLTRVAVLLALEMMARPCS